MCSAHWIYIFFRPPKKSPHAGLSFPRAAILIGWWSSLGLWRNLVARLYEYQHITSKMPHCAAFECNVHPTIGFHVFPRDNELRQAWIYVIGRTSLPKDPRLCSKHFEEHCFKESYLMKLRLLGSSRMFNPPKPDAVPTLFSLRPAAPVRLSSVKRAEKRQRLCIILYYFAKLTLTRFLVNSPDSRKNLSLIWFQALLEFVVTPFHGPRELWCLFTIVFCCLFVLWILMSYWKTTQVLQVIGMKTNWLYRRGKTTICRRCCQRVFPMCDMGTQTECPPVTTLVSMVKDST